MTYQRFDEKTIQWLKYYVYALVHPETGKIFYIGKGKGNRVFQHAESAISDIDAISAKLEVIRGIHNEGARVRCILVRHGLDSELVAYEVEAALIDLVEHGIGQSLTNQVVGHHFIDRGWMATDEIQRKYNAPKLEKLANDCVIININKKYLRGSQTESVYDATNGIWAMNIKRLVAQNGDLIVKYVLSEYKGLIVEVFAVDKWSLKERTYNATSKRAGLKRMGVAFDGKVAEESVRNLYHNKSIAHLKKRGSASAHRFTL